MGVFSGIAIAWEAYKWLKDLKKHLEADADAYLTVEKAKEWRLITEKWFKALEEGEANSNYKNLPKLIQWLCKLSKVDNSVGTFGLNYLKSQKLKEDSSELMKPIYPVH